MRFELTFSVIRCITYTNPTQPNALPTELYPNIKQTHSQQFILQLFLQGLSIFKIYLAQDNHYEKSS